MFIGITKPIRLTPFLGKGFHNANTRYGVCQNVGELRPDTVYLFKTCAQFVTHYVNEPNNEWKRQQSGSGQANIDTQQNSRCHQNHQDVCREIKQVQRQKDIDTVCLSANAIHQVARTTAPKIFQRQTHQVFIGCGA